MLYSCKNMNIREIWSKFGVVMALKWWCELTLTTQHILRE